MRTWANGRAYTYMRTSHWRGHVNDIVYVGVEGKLGSMGRMAEMFSEADRKISCLLNPSNV